MWPSEGTQLLVGSKSTQPKPGHQAEHQAWEASAPTRRGRPAGGMVRRYPLTYLAGNPNDRIQAICRWEKSWQTPRRFSKKVSTGVVTSVALASKRKSWWMRAVRSKTASSRGRPGENDSRA